MGPEAFGDGQAPDKPIFLSIGYARATGATSWRTRASRIATIAAHDERALREHQGRPRGAARRGRDLHEPAMQALGEHGGWPLTVFLTPDGSPSSRGTYFPPDDRYGRPASRSLLDAIAEPRTRRQARASTAARCTRRAGRADANPGARGADRRLIAALSTTASAPAEQSDPTHGGFGGAPKFPPARLDLPWRCSSAYAPNRRRQRRDGHYARQDGARAGSTITRRRLLTATPWTSTGSCRTSRRCSTTTRSCSRLRRGLRSR